MVYPRGRGEADFVWRRIQAHGTSRSIPAGAGKPMRGPAVLTGHVSEVYPRGRGEAPCHCIADRVPAEVYPRGRGEAIMRRITLSKVSSRMVYPRGRGEADID